MNQLPTRETQELAQRGPEADDTIVYSYHWRSEHRFHFVLVFLVAPLLFSPAAAFVSEQLVVEAQVVLAVVTPLAMGGLIGWVMQWRSRVSSFGLIVNRVGGSILLSVMTWGYCLIGAFVIVADLKADTWQELLLLYGVVSLMYSFLISPLVLIWLLGVTNDPYEPNTITREARGDVERIKMLARDVQRSSKERAELIGELARADVHSMMSAMTAQIHNAEAVELVSHRLLHDADSDRVQRLLDSYTDHFTERALDEFMTRWSEHPERMRLFLSVARQKRIQTHDKWAHVVLRAAHEADVSGAQMAAITTLGSARLTQHALAIEYITKFGMPAHIPHLREAKRNFSLNIPLGKKIDGIIAHIEREHGVVRGALSMTADERMRGGLSQSD